MAVRESLNSRKRGNRLEIVEYANIQLTKAPHVLRGMGLAFDKNEEAMRELAYKGMANEPRPMKLSLVVRCQPVPRLRTSPQSDRYSAGARPSVTPAGAGASCLSSISSNVRPLGSNPNAQNPTTPRMYHTAK
jgi:hypothetical protein